MQIRSAFACALHMHQPTIPAGADAALISHLQWMLEHPGEGDNHNAEPFAHCYRRLADILAALRVLTCDLPMQSHAVTRFHQRYDPLVAADPAITQNHNYQQALLHLQLQETRCFHDWGQGTGAPTPQKSTGEA